jgi:hypothetical protein
MKKHIIPIFFSALCLLALVSCDKDKESEGLTYVENFPVITDAEGNKFETVNLKLGESFTPACKATLGGSDITSKVNISIVNLITGDVAETIATDAPGMFEVRYTANTETGLTSWSEKQSVYVYNPGITLSIAGSWTLDEPQTSAKDVGGRLEPKDDKEKFCPYSDFYAFFETSGPVNITIKQVVPGFFSVSDFFFGWYENVRGYGAQYEAPGYIALNDDNTLTHISSSTPWGNSITEFSGKYDPDTNTISFEYDYVGSAVVKGVIKLDE